MKRERRVYIGQYKKYSTALHFNVVRYTTMTLVLDYFCLFHCTVGDTSKTREEMADIVIKLSVIKDNDDNRCMIETVIGNMIMMGLLESQGEYIFITDKGKFAYENHTFHLAMANVYEAESSRRLAKKALCIAIASIVITLITLIVPAIIS